MIKVYQPGEKMANSKLKSSDKCIENEKSVENEIGIGSNCYASQDLSYDESTEGGDDDYKEKGFSNKNSKNKNHSKDQSFIKKNQNNKQQKDNKSQLKDAKNSRQAKKSENIHKDKKTDITSQKSVNVLNVLNFSFNDNYVKEEMKEPHIDNFSNEKMNTLQNELNYNYLNYNDQQLFEYLNQQNFDNSNVQLNKKFEDSYLDILSKRKGNSKDNLLNNQKDKSNCSIIEIQNSQIDKSFLSQKDKSNNSNTDQTINNLQKKQNGNKLDKHIPQVNDYQSSIKEQEQINYLGDNKKPYNTRTRNNASTQNNETQNKTMNYQKSSYTDNQASTNTEVSNLVNSFQLTLNDFKWEQTQQIIFPQIQCKKKINESLPNNNNQQGQISNISERIKEFKIHEDVINTMEIEQNIEKKENEMIQNEHQQYKVNEEQTDITLIESKINENNKKANKKEHKDIHENEKISQELQLNEININQMIFNEEAVNEINLSEVIVDEVKKSEVKSDKKKKNKKKKNKNKNKHNEKQEKQEPCSPENQNQEYKQNSPETDTDKNNLQQINESQQIIVEQVNVRVPHNIFYKGMYVESQQNDQYLEKKRDFENKIKQKKQISYEEYNLPPPTIIHQEALESKSSRTYQNVLQRELGIGLPETQIKSKKSKKKDVIASITENEEEKQNQESIRTRKQIQKDIEKEDAKLAMQLMQAELNQNYDDEDNNQDDEISNYESSSKKENSTSLRRSGRSKKAKYQDNKIYNLYSQKARPFNEDKNIEQANQVNDSSYETKQSEQAQQTQQTTSKKKEKHKKKNSENKSKKSSKSSKKEKAFLEMNSSYERLIDDSFNSCDYYDEDKHKKSSKKLKQNEDTLIINSENSHKKNLILFNVYNSSNEDIDEKKDNERKHKSKQSKKKRNFRNLDTKDDETEDDINQNDGDDSFLRILNSDMSIQEEIKDTDYIFDKLKEYDGDGYLKLTTANPDQQIDEEDCPFDMPDIDELIKDDEPDVDEIQKIDGSIHFFEKQIQFLRTDSKLKSLSVLNDNNYKQTMEKEIIRLQNRKELLINEMNERQKIKIEKYQQKLQYFDQKLESKYLIQNSTKKVLNNNVNDKIPSYRLIKYKQNNKVIQNQINLCYIDGLKAETNYDLIGFSNCQKVNDSPIDNTKLIHNFFGCLN